jgi:drug/metabolite transporter (DMT)-like permease
MRLYIISFKYIHMLLESLIIVLIFGSIPIVTKYILQHIQLESFIVISYVVYFGLVLLYLMVMGHEDIYADLVTMNKKKLLYPLLLLCVISSIITTYLYNKLIKNYKAYLVAAITSVYPAIVVILGFLLLNETITFSHIIGVFMCILGVFMLTQ